MTILEVILLVSIIALFIGGVVGVVIWQLKKKNDRFSYITKHGIEIKLSPMLKDLKSEMVEQWTEDLVQFWYGAKGWDKGKIYNEISKSRITIYDEIYLDRFGAKVNGITLGYEIEIAALYHAETDQPTHTPLNKVKSLFRHEESHIVVGALATEIPYNNENHHALFAEVGLGA